MTKPDYKIDRSESPIQLPKDLAISKRWQQLNRMWWESSPMRYDWRKKIAAEPGTLEYLSRKTVEFLNRLMNENGKLCAV